MEDEIIEHILYSNGKQIFHLRRHPDSDKCSARFHPDVFDTLNGIGSHNKIYFSFHSMSDKNFENHVEMSGKFMFMYDGCDIYDETTNDIPVLEKKLVHSFVFDIQRSRLTATLKTCVGHKPLYGDLVVKFYDLPMSECYVKFWFDK